MKTPALSTEQIQVEVHFYHDAEKRKLLDYPTASAIQALVAGQLEIPRAELLTYYLFHHIKLGKPEISTPLILSATLRAA